MCAGICLPNDILSDWYDGKCINVASGSHRKRREATVSVANNKTSSAVTCERLQFISFVISLQHETVVAKEMFNITFVHISYSRFISRRITQHLLAFTTKLLLSWWIRPWCAIWRSLRDGIRRMLSCRSVATSNCVRSSFWSQIGSLAPSKLCRENCS